MNTYITKPLLYLSLLAVLFGLFSGAPGYAGDTAETPQTDRPENPRLEHRNLPFERVNVALFGSGIDTRYFDYPEVYGRMIKTKKSFFGSRSSEDQPVRSKHMARILEQLTVFGDARPQIQDLKVQPNFGPANQSDVIAAIDWLVEQSSTDLALMTTPPFAVPGPDGRLLQKSIQALRDTGTTVIVPAGDSSRDIQTESSTLIPAALPEVITVSALKLPDVQTPEKRRQRAGQSKDVDLRLANFSNYGEEVDLTDHLMSEDQRSTTFSATNVTYAAMHAIADAIYKGAGAQITPDAVRKALLNQAHYPENGWNKDVDSHTEGLVEPQTIFIPKN